MQKDIDWSNLGKAYEQLKERRLGLKVIWAPKYSPQYNAIESTFGVLKQSYRKMRLQAIANNEDLEAQVIVRRAINQLNKEGVQNTC
jgi:transposase